MAYKDKNDAYKAQNKWISEKLDRVSLTMPKGKKDAVKEYASSMGESLNGYINRLIEEDMERGGVSPDDSV